ncbi:hypothetical protein [Ammoniphilus sp. YIM 78166]|uniref:hypothetical protein n=1 Tax=Ammoniphilus sp. YIM 78166 TaxID=1644106 RepID=UPI001430525D|nr:hypothetical protein [Ammoniphilus sp. YIM 78166]
MENFQTHKDDTLVRGMTHLLDGSRDRAGDRLMDPSSNFRFCPLFFGFTALVFIE